MKVGYSYIEFIKAKPCLVCGTIGVDAHHLEAIGMGNNRNKESKKDYSCVPLCRVHHQEYHTIGVNGFQEKYGFNIWRDAFNLLREYYINA